jgi:hypothetical protein
MDASRESALARAKHLQILNPQHHHRVRIGSSNGGSKATDIGPHAGMLMIRIIRQFLLT